MLGAASSPCLREQGQAGPEDMGVSQALSLSQMPPGPERKGAALGYRLLQPLPDAGMRGFKGTE